MFPDREIRTIVIGMHLVAYVGWELRGCVIPVDAQIDVVGVTTADFEDACCPDAWVGGVREGDVVVEG